MQMIPLYINHILQNIAEKESATVKGLEVDIELTKKWMAENRLKMNDTKTEYIVFGNNVQLAKCHHQGIRDW